MKMNSRDLGYLLFIALLCSSAASQADTGVGVKVGTNGLGIELTYNIFEQINLRGGYSNLEYSDDVDTTDVEYDADFEMDGVFLFADWHPFDSSFRVSAGLYNFFNSELTGDAEVLSGTITINDVTYNASDLGFLEAEIEYDTVAPYIGIGWGNAVGNHDWTFTIDLGVLYLGSPDVDINYGCNVPALCDDIDDDVQAEKDELEDEAEDYEWWPVLNLGIAYKF